MTRSTLGTTLAMKCAHGIEREFTRIVLTDGSGELDVTSTCKTLRKVIKKSKALFYIIKLRGFYLSRSYRVLLNWNNIDRSLIWFSYFWNPILTTNTDNEVRQAIERKFTRMVLTTCKTLQRTIVEVQNILHQ